ncbi:MAG: hydroxylamine oxidase [Deltaproteobacteria bacterium]|nr:hydroxylamine oxidase [Deltaproteobacteria bacterium]
MKSALRLLFFLFCVSGASIAAEIPISESSTECLDCHSSIHPGIVEDWKNSRHSRITPGQGMAVEGLGRKISSDSVPESLQSVAVGCAECHTLRADAHADTFEHNGYEIHVVVSPDDCKTCHVKERQQYSKNIMAHAYGNLANNKLFQTLEQSILGATTYKNGKINKKPADEATRAEACYYCHGTRLELAGIETRETELAGELEFPLIKGWPNQGVGRINLDGSKGACTACHPRHAFSIETARMPQTCKECHEGPDVPAFKVYAASKHGNIFSAMKGAWNFKAVPWTIGKDFSTPTCAACHISLLVNTDEDVVVERTHKINDRLPWRIFGLIYAHPHPKEPDTSIIRNQQGQPLPTDLSGEFAATYLIDAKQRDSRRQRMQSVCLSCHDASWTRGHWQRFENTIKQTNASVLTATRIMQDIWKHVIANPADSLFNEAIERKWSDAWLFYANSIRFSSAMGGGGDYGVFADGRYQLTQTIMELHQHLALQKKRHGDVNK